MVDSQQVKYIKWHRMPKYPRPFHTVPFSILRAIGSQVYQQIQTMLVDRPSLQWPIQNRPILQPHPWVCLPVINFQALNHDAPHHLYGNGSPILKSVECNAKHRLLNKIHVQQYLRTVHHQLLWFIHHQHHTVNSRDDAQKWWKENTKKAEIF